MRYVQTLWHAINVQEPFLEVLEGERGQVFAGEDVFELDFEERRHFWMG